MSMTLDGDAFLAGLDRLVRRTDDATQQGMTNAGQAVRREFQTHARRLDGDHANSFRQWPATRSGGRWESICGPTMPYSRKLNRRFHDFENALEASSRGVVTGLARAWQQAMG